MTQFRPEPGEYAPFYKKYIDLVPGLDLVPTLETQLQEWKNLLAGLTEAQAEFRYEPAKWTIKEVLGHVGDTERIFAYRVLRIARGDRTPLSGFEQDDYVREGNFSARKLPEIVEEFAAVRHASILLLKSLGADAWTRRGISNHNEVSVRALGFMIAGHERHHRIILEQRYLSALPRA